MKTHEKPMKMVFYPRKMAFGHGKKPHHFGTLIMILYFEALSQQPQMRLQSHNLHVVLDTLVHRYLFALEDTTIQCHSSSFVNRFEGTLNWNPDLTLPIFLVPKRVPMNNFRTRQQLRDVGPFSVTAGTRFEVAMLQSYTYIYIWCGTIVLSDCWHDVLFLLVKLRHIANQHGNRTSSDFLVEKKPRSGNAWNWQRFIWKWGIPYTPKIHEVGKYVRKDCNRFLDVWEDWADHTGKFMQFLEDGDKQVDGDFSLNVWEGWVCKSLLLAILTITKLNSSLIVERTGANHTGKFNNTED